MGRLVRINPATEEKNSQAAVVATGAHGRLVRTGDVQRTSPVGNTVKLPSAQSVYQKALDEAMMKRAAADRKNRERGRRSYNRSHAQEVREITGDRTKKSITPIIKSAAAGYAADMVGAADTLLRAPSGLNYAASQERGEIEASKKNIAAYTEKLKAAKTEEERQQWQTLIDRNKRLIEINSKAADERVKNYRDTTRGAQEKLQDTYQKLRKIASDNMEKANEGLTPVGKYLNNVGVAGAQMAADAALGGGSALGPMFLRVFGGNSQEAAEAADKPGMSAAEQLDAQNRALLYGTASGAVSIATEKISNVAAPFKKAFGGGFLDKAIDGAIAKMNGNAAGRLALSFLSEGGEEVIEDIVQPALQTIYNGQSAGQNYSELDAAEILNDFLVGGALGLIGSGVEGIHNADARLAAERAAGEAAAPTAEQQNTMPAQPAAAQEGAREVGEGNLAPVPQSAAQGAQEAKADALDAGGRVPLDQYATPENAQQVSQEINDGTLAVDSHNKIYRVDAGEHIDRRDSASVGERSVNAFQFDHPELHQYFAEAAADLSEEMSFAQRGGELVRRTSHGAGDDEYIRTKRGVSERIARLLDDEGVRYDDIDRSIEAIIHNHGQENFAAAKRVEPLLDEMLTNGYTDIHGRYVAPNERYIEAKRAIPGADTSARTREELPLWDMTEGKDGGVYGQTKEQNHAGGAEFADTAKRGTPEAADAARALPDGAAERGERERGGRESGRIPREVRNVGGEDGNALTVQKRLEASGISQFISPREANVPNGASGDNTVTIFDEADWDQELIGAADWAKSKGVKKVTALLGVINIEKNGRTGKAFGVFNADTGEIFVNAGSVQRSVSETIEHETAHYLAEVARRENVRTFMRDVQSRYSSEEWGKVYDAYFDRYAALTGDYAGMSENDIELYVWEEIMGDAYAEIDQYDEKASRFNREAENALSQSGQESKNALQAEGTQGAAEQGRETAAATERRRGPPERFSYAGRDARNADLEALHEAERYEMQNVDAETIRQKTGWFRGADGKWRWEIDDSGMKLRADAADISNYTTLGELVDAPTLFATYPDMKDMSVTFHNLERGQLGGYLRTFDSIELSRELKQKPEALLNSLTHEVQHAIQQREGFTPGANPKYWNRKLEEGYDGRDAETRREGARLREQYEQMEANDPEFMRSMEELNAMAPTVPRGKIDPDTWEQIEPDPPEWERFDERRDQLEEKYGDRVWDYFSLRDSIDRNARDGRLPGDLYRDTAGEIEARDAAARRGLTAEERRGRKPDTGDENTVFADGGESYSIANTRDMPWKDQVRGYFSNDGTIKSSDSLYLGESSVEGVDNAPMYIPTSVITKAIRPPKGSRSAHALSQKNILNLQEGIKNAPVVIDNPARNSIVYVTADQDSAGNYIIAALDKSNDLYGETAHKVTSIHGRENIAAMLEKLGDDATIFIKNENKLNRMLPGNQILKSLALRAKVELDDNSVSGHGGNVKYSAESDEFYERLDEELADEKEIDRQERAYEKAERDGMRTDFPSISAEWKTKLERARAAATNNIKPSGFDSYDAYLDALDKQHAADRAERLRVKSRDEFKGTKALDELGVKIANSAGIYHNAEQLLANDKAAKSIQKATKRAEQRLGATRQEKRIAHDIANGERSMADIPRSVKKSRVLELVDYYTAQKATKTGLLQQQRIEINDALREQARELIGTEAPEINRKGLSKLFDPSKGLVLYHRTPQRIMRALFGWKQGQKINEAVFEPVYENEQERKRFINRLFDEVRTFEGADGEDAALTQRERALAQLMIEGKAVEEMVGKSEIKQQIIHAAENLLDGAEMTDAAREFGLHGKEERELAQRYADWLETKRELDSGSVDKARVENAAKKYSGLYDEFYAAINDFLVAHGYEPIGFIKGYAPHFQPEAENGKLESALKAIGVDLGSGVGKLPTSIAGLTKSFKPNKRYNPFFQHRRGSETDYDIVKGFETYVDYASDVLYHTDDIMRVRQMANYLRSTFAPEEMKADIDQMEAMRYAPADVKEEYLRDKKKIADDTFLSYEDLTAMMEQYTDEKYRTIEDVTEFSDLVTWLDDYANKLAGKQLFEDRLMEREVGREALNVGRKLVSTFARANVAGNLSSSLNQTAQLPLIAGELGPKYVAEAIGDIASGKAKGDFADRSDFLTEKRGIRYLTNTKGDKFTTALFWPLERMDYLMSTIAVRGRYRKELAEGKSEKEALRAADRWARDIMGTRSKGSVPLTFQSKNLIAQMMNMFQVEAANTFEHVTQDRLGPGFKEMAAKIGKDKAIKKLASDAIAYMLLAFLLNRLDEELYGGTPAPFDVFGMGLNAVASGNGLTSSDLLKTIMDNVTESFFGERLFDTDPDAMNDEFDGWAAAEDTMYNISNDVPYVRNMAGLMGWGDQTLPMPDIAGTLSKGKKALKNADSPGEFWAEVAKQLVGLAGDTLPGGRQVEKMLQGGDAVIRGGSYQGFGDSKRLQYPVNSLLEDPFEALRAAIFGKNALPESRTYWAAGGKALSAAQTRLYEDLVDSGLSRKRAYEILKRFNDATADLEADRDKNGNPIGGSKKEKIVKEINKLPLSRRQKNMLYLSRGYSEKDLNSLPWN